MIYEFFDNKFILYQIQLNKNYLKKIRKMIISKYGVENRNLKSLNREDFRMYANMYHSDITPIVVKKRYNINKVLIENTFYQIKNPPLAAVIIKILENPSECLSLLLPFIQKDKEMISYEKHQNIKMNFDDSDIQEIFNNYLQALQTMTDEEMKKIHSGESRFQLLDINLEEDEKYIGIEYLPKILENIAFIPVYQSTFTNIENLCNQLEIYGIYTEQEDVVKENSTYSNLVKEVNKVKRKEK